MKTYSLLLLLLVPFIFASCQDDEAPGQDSDNNPMQEEQTTYTVEIIGNSFSPESLSISVGDTVVWINTGSTIHTSTSGSDCDSDGNWDSGSLSPEESFSYVFSTGGTFEYFCIPHCELGMTGSVTVEE